MATLAELRERGETLYTGLLTTQTGRPPARRARGLAAAPPRLFSWFDPHDAVASLSMAFRLAALAATRKRINDGLAAALDHVEAEAREVHPEQVRQAFALFVTHNRDGRRLGKPRTVAAAPKLFNPPPVRGKKLAISIGGASPGLDYWREDALANEHHQHWHEVYPYTGLPPNDFRVWATNTSQADMVAILEAIAPGQNWAQQLQGATVEQLASLFAQVVQAQGIDTLPANLYRLLFRLNDRQGELFFYMHQQMLARYDAELLSNGLTRVDAFEPAKWPQPIVEGHDPQGLPQFGMRPQNQTLDANAVSLLTSLDTEITNALAAASLLAADGGGVLIDDNLLGEAVEATVPQLRDLDPNSYGGLHNTGHGLISSLSNPRGVMASTVTAIRDQIFWRWHKYVDDCSAVWQETQLAEPFGDAPVVTIRNGADENGRVVPWGSPDIILCRTVDLPAGQDGSTVGEQFFGGDNWDSAFAAGPVGDGSFSIVDELTTTIASVQFGGRAVQYLTHEPFSYFIRLENPTANPADVTVRIYLAPASEEADRRAWIEMDKFLLTMPATTKAVIYRPDTDSSVVKRAIDLNPSRALSGDMNADGGSYCDCGWPYTLLLPRGTSDGMAFRLVVLVSDATVDLVPAPDQCGSMSYCGAVDRYPDARVMGYPFARPFAPADTGIRDTFVALPNAAGRSLTIRHT
jgi:hypothetical protein